MNKKEQAKIILENLDEHAIQIDWNREDHFLNVIEKGLKEIEEKKRSEENEIL